MKRLNMHNPPHPGDILKELYLKPANMSITAFAEHIGVDRKTVSRLVNGTHGVTAEMDLRLSRAFNTSPGLWLGMQVDYDLWHTSQREKNALGKIAPLAYYADAHA